MKPSLKIVLYYNSQTMTNIFDTYKKLLTEFISFKSISTDPKYLGEIEKAVLWLKNLFTSHAFRVEVWRNKVSNPVVFANLVVNSRLPTILIYGHYDVQPAEKSDGWKSEPFSLFQGKTKLIGRGIVDNKGQVLTHIVNIFELAGQNKLAYNVKFLIEGNEETGSTPWSLLLKKNRKKLACDFLLVSDGELTNNKPTIEISLRGGFNSTLTYTTGKNNLHSGLAGGAVPNAALELSKFLGKLYNSKNSLSFGGFYKNVDKASPSQLSNNRYLAETGVDAARLMGVNTLLTEPGLDFFSQTGLRPTIQISGLKAGYIDTGYANIVPAIAEARLNFRIVPSQKAASVAREFEKFVARNTPRYVKYSLKIGGLHDPVKIDTNNKYVGKAESILKRVYKTRVNRRNVGGAIPFVGDVKQILGVDTLLVPMANEDCNMHGVNENFDIALIKKALEFSREFLATK